MPKPEWLIAAPISATNNKAETPLFQYFVRILRGENLQFAESLGFFKALTDRNSDSAQIAGALTALTAKGETSEEIAGMLTGMNELSVKIKVNSENFINIAATGASSVKAFDVSAGAAFVAAGAGLPVAKQTARSSLSSTCGADVLEELGIKAGVEPKLAQACLNGAGIGFLFSTKLYSSSRRLKDISRSLGVRTCVNLLEDFANPSNASKQLLGVWHPSLMKITARAISLLGTERSWVVHGFDGLDELTLAGETVVIEVAGKQSRTFKVTPEDFGLRSAKIDHLRVETAGESAAMIKDVLENKRRDEARSIIILNAAAALFIAGMADSPKKAARLAEQSIDSRSAQTKLERLVAATNKK